MSARKPLIAGNWKMFGLGADLAEIVSLQTALGGGGGVDVVVCPPATLVSRAAAALASTPFGLGAQDCHPDPEGAHTGDVSAAMLAEAGATWVILGHSERRRDHGESDDLVRRKVEAAASAGLMPIVCVGETAEERKVGREQAVVGAQLAQSLPGARPAGLVIAYEPVWAIGTGVTPTLDEIAAMHAFIRKALPDGENVRVLYGGSVKPQNARDIFATANVDGALVGGASLKAADFSAIIRAHPVFSVRTGN